MRFAALLSPVPGQPTDALARTLTAGPLVVHAHISEADARQLVETFRALGARAEIVEAVDPETDTAEPAHGTLPLFASLEAALDKAWRKVIIGEDPAATVDGHSPTPAAPPVGVHEADTLRMEIVTVEAFSRAQPPRAPTAALVATTVQPAVNV